MTSLAFMECCQRLAVTPKTLRQWLAQAEMSLHAHPTDARITCLTRFSSKPRSAAICSAVLDSST